MATLLKGAPVAKEITALCAKKAEKLIEAGVTPTLAMIRVGESDADVYYERAAMKRCEACGIAVRNYMFPERVEEDELILQIRQLNVDDSVHGVLIFRPLPKHISDARVRASLDVRKDVDGITDASLGGIFTGARAGFNPCTAESALSILKYYGVKLEGARAAVVGRSLVIGKPVSQLLINENATVTVCHSKTKNLSEELRRADIIVSAVGKPGTVTVGAVKPGQVIIDVGIATDENGNMVGDVDFGDVAPFVGAITPVPGGVGAVTTAILAYHTVQAAMRARR
ncbi:MAG: bifunctional 5,10-methylene-tetrahydrofolate dehydrogenase/5,10-methylene-tetrahydrofolate cyclohydrolase [Oscillospiraceae bacterium]|nr:bifunctional 5,10-methylene-tetrahydrofolate dehydrogenase/5,10-methylene-tetrahydrofolate cyclohydrolase [Oscillospiraceae bacterium]